MQPPYLNVLSISPYAKEVPYAGKDTTRADGQINYGFKNLIRRPTLIEVIPELDKDPALKSLIYTLNEETCFFTIGCFSGEIKNENCYQHHGYLEFAWNCQVCVRDAIHYFSLFFHFDQFLQGQHFTQNVRFHWLVEETHFLDVNLTGFCCAVFVNTAHCISSAQANDDWQVSLAALKSFLGSVAGRSSTPIYEPPVR